MRGYLRNERGRVALLALLIILGIFFEIANPQLVQMFIDEAQADAKYATLVGLAATFVGLAVVRQIMAVGAAVLGESVGWTATNALRGDLAAHVLGLDMAFHNSTSPGALNERIDGDVTNLATFFTQMVIKVIGNGLLMIGVLIAVARVDARVGLAIGAFALITLAVLVRVRTWGIPYQVANRARSAEFAGFIGERLSGTEDIRALGAVNHTMWQLDTLLRAWYPHNWRSRMVFLVTFFVTVLLFGVGITVALWVGSSLWQAGLISIGTVYLIFSYTEMLRRPVNEIRQQVEDLQRASASITRVRDLFVLKPAINDDQARPPGPSVPSAPSVAFCNVTFAYEDDAPVLHDVSFELPGGATLGLLGRTGSGKTTVARLLTRLYEPKHGDILLAGDSMRHLPLTVLRQRVGLVTQDVQLFNASVRENVTLFDDRISDDAIMGGLSGLELGEWLTRLPDGLETRLKSGGAGISAGEAQLLAFARMFLRAPGLVILDEASSRLDPATERLLDVATARLLQNRTGIIIAHRLATVQRCDYILILDHGRVLEFGRRLDLALNPASNFYSLLRADLHEVLA